MSTRPRRRAAFLLSALLLAASTTAGTAAHAAPVRPGGYVALGDSYSSGLGARSYDSGSGECRRSARAYPALWADAHRDRTFAFTACSGATTKDVAEGQLAPLDGRTALVSVTAGANDAGFAEVMTTCVLSGDQGCARRIDTARKYIEGPLAKDLDRMYDAIRGHAPAARVVVLGYPHLFTVPGGCAGGLSDTKRAAVNAAVDAVDKVTAERAARHGFVFADVRNRFAGHGICGSAPWIRSITFPVDESYHPDATGQGKGYFPEFTATARP
ncbi:SGNH/GDSL hydrolase family protein [Streptomyces sp. cg36]|uniref:SGNH/GDSL hydrolase family protein n=1 Tax=Streptomyces sp. cg36 TaxID=3238798 RepID=UPI0034E2EF23